MIDKMTWFHNFDVRHDIESNRYFATVSIMFAALLGAIDGAGNTLHSWFDWDTDVNIMVVLGLLIHIYGLNLAETIMASKRVSSALGRAALLFVYMVLAWIVGKVLAILALVCIAAWVFFCVFKAGLSVMFDDGKYYFTDEFGFKHYVHKNIFTGDYFDNMGHTYIAK